MVITRFARNLPLVAAAALWLGSALPANASYCVSNWPSYPTDALSEGCPAPGSIVSLPSGVTTLSSRGTYRGVTFVISESNTTLDCNGKLLVPGDLTSEAARRSAITINDGGSGTGPSNVTVKNCYVQNYAHAVWVQNAVTDEQRDTLNELYLASPVWSVPVYGVHVRGNIFHVNVQQNVGQQY